MNKGTVKSKRRPRTRKDVDINENPDYGPGAEEVSPRRYTAVSPQEAGTDGKILENGQQRSSCCVIL